MTKQESRERLKSRLRVLKNWKNKRLIDNLESYGEKFYGEWWNMMEGKSARILLRANKNAILSDLLIKDKLFDRKFSFLAFLSKKHAFGESPGES